MEFDLSPELLAVRESARAFTREHIVPGADAWERERRFPAEVIEKLKGTGFLSMTIPREYGGSGLGNLPLCVMLEEINRGCASTGVTISVQNSLVGSPLTKWGNAEQKQRYLPRLATGEWLGAYCLSEAGAGSDAAALRCAARKEGSEYVLDGAKLWITTGEKADFFIIFARTHEQRTRGISAFLVERAYPGIRTGKKEDKLGIRASPTNEILLSGCRVPAANLLGEEGQGFTIALDTLDGGRLGIASQALGIGRACLEDSIAFAKEHHVAGVPVADQQVVQWKLADMATELDAARLLTYRAAILRDRKQKCTSEAAMAKLMASRACNKAAREAVSIHGAAGATQAHRVERYLRDARITEIYEGVTDIQRLVIARSLLGA